MPLFPVNSIAWLWLVCFNLCSFRIVQPRGLLTVLSCRLIIWTYFSVIDISRFNELLAVYWDVVHYVHFFFRPQVALCHVGALTAWFLTASMFLVKSAFAVDKNSTVEFWISRQIFCTEFAEVIEINFCDNSEGINAFLSEGKLYWTSAFKILWGRSTGLT